MAPANFSDFVVTSPFTAYAWGAPGEGVPLASANQIALYPFIVPYPQKVTDLCVFIVTGDAENNTDIGIYDFAGNLLGHIGAQVIASSDSFSFALTDGPIVIGPGMYFLGFTSEGTTVELAIGASSEVNFGLKLNSAGSTSSGGALPSTITVNTGLSEGDSSPFPGCPPVLILK